jgi:hypothetical protein
MFSTVTQTCMTKRPGDAFWPEVPLSDPAMSSIPTAGFPSRGRSFPVADLPITGRPVTGSGGSLATYCTALFKVSFLWS